MCHACDTAWFRLVCGAVRAPCLHAPATGVTTPLWGLRRHHRALSLVVLQRTLAPVARLVAVGISRDVADVAVPLAYIGVEVSLTLFKHDDACARLEVVVHGVATRVAAEAEQDVVP